MGAGQEQARDSEQQEREPDHYQVSHPAQAPEEVITPLPEREMVVRVVVPGHKLVPGHKAAPMEPQDLHGPEAPAVALGVKPGVGGRDDAPAEAAGQVYPG